MESPRALFLAVNVVGAVVLLGSYAHGVLTHPQTRDALWGATPDWLRTVNVISIGLAALGYLALTYYLGWRVDPETVRVWGSYGFSVFTALYAVVFLASAPWMPLTFRMLEDPSPALWWWIRTLLFVVAIAALALLAALSTARGVPGGWPYRLALLGLVAICFQTVILDAIRWPLDFRAGL